MSYSIVKITNFDSHFVMEQNLGSFSNLVEALERLRCEVESFLRDRSPDSCALSDFWFRGDSSPRDEEAELEGGLELYSFGVQFNLECLDREFVTIRFSAEGSLFEFSCPADININGEVDTRDRKVLSGSKGRWLNDL